MTKIHTYLNFNGTCEEAFLFYSSVFKTPLTAIHRMKDLPPDPEYPINSADANLVMHTSLKLNEHTMLMGSDCVESFGQKVVNGNNTSIMIDTKTKEEAQAIYEALSKNAQKIEMPLGEQFWAELYASFIDQFGISWMVHYEGNKAV